MNHTKKTALAVLAALAMAFLVPIEAFGNGVKPPADPPPTPSPGTATSTSGASAGSAAIAGAAAGAQSGASSSVDAAQGQQQGQGQQMGQGQTMATGSTDVRAWSLFLPPPAWTPPMPRPDVPVLCPAPTETQDSLSVGAGVLFSRATSLRDNDPCTAIKFSQMLWDRCQFRKADRALAVGLKLFARRAGEDWDASPDMALTDYTPQECAVLMAPPPAPLPTLSPVTAAEPPTKAVVAAVEAPKPCPKGWRRNSKGVCYDPAWARAKPSTTCEPCRQGQRP